MQFFKFQHKAFVDSGFRPQRAICCHYIRRLWHPGTMCNDGHLHLMADLPPLAVANALIYRRHDKQCIMPIQHQWWTNAFAATRGDKLTSNPQNQTYIRYCTVVRSTEPRAENFVKFGHVVFEICDRTNRQTDKYKDIPTCWSQYFAPISGSNKNLTINYTAIHLAERKSEIHLTNA